MSQSAEDADVIVIGGGAAGLMCALTAGQRGRRVRVIEHANRVRQEDPDVGRRALQFHQYRHHAPRTSCRRIRTSASRHWRASGRRSSSRWSNATASRITRRSSASCFATTRPSRSWRMLLDECAGGRCAHRHESCRSSACSRSRAGSCVDTRTRALACAGRWWSRPVACRSRAWARPASATSSRASSATRCCRRAPAWCR